MTEINSFERGRRRGVCEALDVLMDLARGGNWEVIGRLKDLAIDAEHDADEFDLQALLCYLVQEQEEEEVAILESDAGLFGE